MNPAQLNVAMSSLGLRFPPAFGQIKVTIPSGAVRTWKCVADGVADNRDTVYEAMYYAAANMPSVNLNSTGDGFAIRNAAPSRGILVEFGAGDYGMSGGVDLRIAFGKMGLTVHGQGEFLTRFRYNGAANLAGSQYIMFKVAPSSELNPLLTAVHPTYGDYHNYLRDVDFGGMGFYDDNPGRHQTAGIDGGTSGSVPATGTATSWNAGTFTLTDAEGTLSNARYAFATNPYSQLRNVTTGASGLIISNTATSVTLDSNGLIGGLRAGVEDNAFAANDVYSISLHTGVEESHGIQIFHTLNAKANDMFFDSIGDESICFEQCIGGVMSHNKLFNTPSRGGGQGLNCVTGRNILITDNICQGSSVRGVKSKVSGSSAIGLEILGNTAAAMSDVIISNNIITDYDVAGMIFNNAYSAGGISMSRVQVTDNVIDNCGGGIKLEGDFVHEAFKLASNTITNCIKTGTGNTNGTGTGAGIEIDLLAANNIDCTIENNTIKTVGSIGILAGGTDLNLVNNHVSYAASHAIQLPNNVRTLVRGGSIDHPGTSGTGKSIDAFSYANGLNVEVDGVTCTNTVDTTSTINFCKTVDDCTIRATTNSIANTISGVTNASGNTLDGGIRPYASATGGRISRNKIKYIGTTNAEAIALVSGNTGFRVHDNDIDTSNAAATYRKAITLAAGANNNWIQNNKCVVSTAAVAITDAGTGNIFKGNSGNATSGSGATITAAATSVVVTHGVGYTPLPGDIVVTPTLLSSAQSFWVSNITSAEFTINVNVAPGAGTATFDWSVDGYRS